MHFTNNHMNNLIKLSNKNQSTKNVISMYQKSQPIQYN